MDCQYIQQNDLAEKYLRGELAEAERIAYEEHLQQCDTCRKELEHQRVLIAGLREIGRAGMKQEIRRQVKERRSTQTGIDWGLLLKVAAVLLFVVITPGVIYYYQFVLPPQQEIPLAVAPGASTENPETIQGGTAHPESPIRSTPAREETAKKSARMQKPAPPRTVPSGEPVSVNIGKAAAAGTRQSAKAGTAGGVGKSKVPAERIPRTGDRRLPPLYQRRGGKGKQPPQKKYLEPIENLADRKISAAPPEEPPQVYRFFGYLNELKTGEQTGEAVENVVGRTGGGNTLLFRAGKNLLKIHLTESESLETDSTAGNLPRAFPVKFISRQPGSMEMNWQVNRAFRKYLPSKIQIEETGSGELRIQLGEKFVYRLGTANDATEAVLIK